MATRTARSTSLRFARTSEGQVVIEGLKGRPVAEICTAYQIGKTQRELADRLSAWIDSLSSMYLDSALK